MRGKVTLVVAAILTGLIASAALSKGATAQEAPAQPPAEAELAATFQAAAPGLFENWKRDYRKALTQMELGDETPGVCGDGYTAYFFSFMRCMERKTPALIEIDVLRKPDSLLTPFLGILRVRLSENCHVRRIVPPGASGWTRANFDKIADGCLGQTYEQCIKAGGKPAPKLVGSTCTGGPESSFVFEDEIVISYRWSQGGWQFEREELKNPRRVPASKT